MVDDDFGIGGVDDGVCGVVGDEAVGWEVEGEDGGGVGMKTRDLVLEHSMALRRVA